MVRLSAVTTGFCVWYNMSLDESRKEGFRSLMKVEDNLN